MGGGGGKGTALIDSLKDLSKTTDSSSDGREECILTCILFTFYLALHEKAVEIKMKSNWTGGRFQTSVNGYQGHF